MKIISKHKDYYDYLVGIYGEDPLIILDRRDYDLPDFSDRDQLVDLYICGLNICGLLKDNKFYYGEDIEQFSTKYSNYKDEYFIRNDNGVGMWILKYPILSNLNTKLGCPILLRENNRDDNDIKNFYKFPILKNLGIQSYIPAEKMWLMLSEFLSKKENVIDNRTNKEKILSAGFDLKDSFRGK